VIRGQLPGPALRGVEHREFLGSWGGQGHNWAKVFKFTAPSLSLSSTLNNQINPFIVQTNVI